MEFVRRWAGWIAVVLLASIMLVEVPRGFVLVAIAAAAIGLYWLFRGHDKRKRADSQRYRDGGGPRPLAKGPDGPDQDALRHRPLHEVADVRLAAVILMIQLVRTGAPLTASEKNEIYDMMADPLGIEDRQAMFELAWQHTDRGRVFSPVADDLTPLLVQHLAPAERLNLIDMLTRVANAYGEASDLQHEAIVRFKRRLMADAQSVSRQARIG